MLLTFINIMRVIVCGLMWDGVEVFLLFSGRRGSVVCILCCFCGLVSVFVIFCVDAYGLY